MFAKEGTVNLIVGEIKFTECRFLDGKSANDFDICVEVTDAADATQHDWARLEWSENYGKGTMATMKQREITMRTLRGIGVDGDDLTALPEQLGGKTVAGFVKKTENKGGKTFYNVYLGGGGGNAPKSEDVLSAEELKRRLTGASGSAPAATSAGTPPQAAAAKNPFAKSSKTPF